MSFGRIGRRTIALGVALALLGASVLGSRPAQALNRDVKAMLVIGGYGMLGGTVLGAAALPFNQNLRTVFIGTSLGLYLGIAIGIYYIYDRYDQDNPLRMRPGDRARDNAAVEQELRQLACARAQAGFEVLPVAQQPLRVDVPVIRF